jgi:hypothetical protein
LGPDDATSQIARNYDDTKKVEDLLNKLNFYIKGGEPDVDKVTVLSMPQIQGSTQVDSNSVIETNYPPIVEQESEYKTAPVKPKKPLPPPRVQSRLLQKVEMQCSSDEEEGHVCTNVHHRFHSHAKITSHAERVRLLNFSRKVSHSGLPDMEFALTPVPGPANKMKPIYQRTKLVTDQRYVS